MKQHLIADPSLRCPSCGGDISYFMDGDGKVYFGEPPDFLAKASCERCEADWELTLPTVPARCVRRKEQVWA